jgi:hypothetical protein
MAVEKRFVGKTRRRVSARYSKIFDASWAVEKECLYSFSILRVLSQFNGFCSAQSMKKLPGCDKLSGISLAEVYLRGAHAAVLGSNHIFT